MGCPTCTKMPGLGAQMVNAAAATYRVAAAAVRGDAVKASEAIITARQSICLTCSECVTITKGGASQHGGASVPASLVNKLAPTSDLRHPTSAPVFHRCSACGCWLDGKYFSKWSLATESCPLGKWGAE